MTPEVTPRWARQIQNGTLPNLTPDDVLELVRLSNESNLGHIPRDRWPEDDIETVDKIVRGTSDFVVMAALQHGLRELVGAVPVVTR